jgi:hypothetical protein
MTQRPVNVVVSRSGTMGIEVPEVKENRCHGCCFNMLWGCEFIGQDLENLSCADQPIIYEEIGGCEE